MVEPLDELDGAPWTPDHLVTLDVRIHAVQPGQVTALLRDGMLSIGPARPVRGDAGPRDRSGLLGGAEIRLSVQATALECWWVDPPDA
ncbi:hypothetical protein JSY14_03770 [Brachybacterium sp. EF45031]|uniref:hypothetical protein n=1 Tax=Brachybacterium sillae TaxID=2810536 RepID=UPI00217CC2A5|nr:hypothetical protein [Brachybacterium sillae]MCS6711175.1 hypothetical protein [Brachybacterium sillae]